MEEVDNRKNLQYVNTLSSNVCSIFILNHQSSVLQLSTSVIEHSGYKKIDYVRIKEDTYFTLQLTIKMINGGYYYILNIQSIFAYYKKQQDYFKIKTLQIISLGDTNFVTSKNNIQAVTSKKQTFTIATNYRKEFNKLNYLEQQYNNIVDCKDYILCIISNKLTITFTNKTFQNKFELDRDIITGKNFTSLIMKNAKKVERILYKLISNPKINRVNIKLKMSKTNGKKINIKWCFSRIKNEFGDYEIQGFGIDISNAEVAIKESKHLREYDQTTGFLNINSFCKIMSNRPTNNKYAILYLSINNYRLINTKHGFKFGEKILIEASKRLKKSKQAMLICRPSYKGFIVSIKFYELRSVNEIASSLLSSLSGLYCIKNERIKINAKVGIAIYPEDSLSIDEVIRKAESALPKAKRNQNNIAFYDKSFYFFLQRKLDVEQRLLIALEDDLLKVFLQPKVNLITRKTIGYEALLRWDDPILGYVEPMEFIEIAESMAFFTRIDRYVLKTVFKYIKYCLDKKLDILPIAVNITSSHFSEPSLVEFILLQSKIFNVDLRYLELEITEGILLEMNEKVEKNLEVLRSKLIKVSIDDFGTGYSSLSYIRKFSVDAIKIDKSFIDDITDCVGKQLISAVIAIAKAIHLDVIAEGVETEEQLQILLELGCKIGQGYLFAKPKYICDVLSISD